MLCKRWIELSVGSRLLEWQNLLLAVRGVVAQREIGVQKLILGLVIFFPLIVPLSLDQEDSPRLCTRRGHGDFFFYRKKNSWQNSPQVGRRKKRKSEMTEKEKEVEAWIDDQYKKWWGKTLFERTNLTKWILWINSLEAEWLSWCSSVKFVYFFN